MDADSGGSGPDAVSPRGRGGSARARLAALLGVALLSGLGECPAITASGPGYSVTVTPTPKEATVTVEAGYSIHFQPKNADGEPVGKRSQLDGPATYTLRVPSDASGFDSTSSPIPSTASAPGAGSTGGLLPPPGLGFGLGDPWVQGLGAAEFGIASMQSALGGDPAEWTALRCTAVSASQAESVAHGVVAAGPGTALPQGVVVDVFVRGEIGWDKVVIRSSLPERFASFVLEADGEVVADLASGFNTTVLSEGNGWRTVVAEIPFAILLSDTALVLSQEGKDLAEPMSMGLAF